MLQGDRRPGRCGDVSPPISLTPGRTPETAGCGRRAVGTWGVRTSWSWDGRKPGASEVGLKALHSVNFFPRTLTSIPQTPRFQGWER